MRLLTLVDIWTGSDTGPCRRVTSSLSVGLDKLVVFRVLFPGDDIRQKEKFLQSIQQVYLDYVAVLQVLD